MPKKAKELTAKQVRDLKHPGDVGYTVVYPVGGVAGLLMQITPNDARSWVLRATVGTKRRDIGLGSFPDVTLAQARERAREAKELIWQGIDPVEQRKATRAALEAAQARNITFAQAFERYAAEKVKEFSTDRYRKQWRRTVEQYALPVIGQRPIDAIDLHDVLKVLEPIWQDKTETASKLRQKIEGVLSWATVKGHRSGDNPARWEGNLKHALAAPSKIAPVKNYPAVQVDDAPRWFDAVKARGGVAARALEFQAMTATRIGAVRLATWAEIDLVKRHWTIQPGRASSKIPRDGEAKTVPLTDAMIALLESLPRFEGSDFVFCAARGGALSDAAIGKTMRMIHEADLKAGGAGFVDKRTGEPAVPHGLRSLFRTWVGERTNFDRDLAEVALFHKVGSKTEQAYARSDMIEKRRHLMKVWGQFLNGEAPENVIQLSEARA